jgi:Protein of unknown function (DUF2541)
VKRSVTSILAVAGLLIVSGAVSAESRHLGSTRLSHLENDTDVVRTSCKPRIHAIKLEAKRGQVEIEALWVRYRNGESERLEVRDRIAKGGQTRWIDLRGGKRCVVAVGVIGDTELSLDQARVDIYGRW